MVRYFQKMSKKISQVPGALIHVGEQRDHKVNISLMTYDADELSEVNINEIDESTYSPDEKSLKWLHLDGVHDIEHIKGIGEFFGIHSLALEDILNTGHRPKIEDFESYQFAILKMLRYDTLDKQVKVEQISLILGPNFVISCQESKYEIFSNVRQRLRKGHNRLRKWGSDYLFYTLLDTIVDNYFTVLENIGEELEEMEADLMNNSKQDSIHELHKTKKDLVYIRRLVWPLREMIGNVLREETDLISEKTSPFLRDVFDHIIQVAETIDTFRDMVGGMQDLYLSSMSNKMNEVMKVLTIIATIFIPLTFIAGIYGMNFNTQASPFNMPELNSPFGYIGVWIIMILTGVGMIFYFKRKKWL